MIVQNETLDRPPTPPFNEILRNFFAKVPQQIRYFWQHEKHWLLIVIPFLVLLIPTVRTLAPTWFALDSPLFLQPLVFLGAFLLAYSRRNTIINTYNELKQIFPADSPKRRGNILLIVLGGILILLGNLALMDPLSILGIILTIIGIVYFFYGPFVVKTILPAVAFLLLAIPLPKAILSKLTGWAQNGTYQGLSSVFKTNAGTVLSGDFAMQVTPLATGLHLFVPVLLFTLWWIFYRRLKISNAVILFIVVTLLTLLANIVRLVLICWIGGKNPDAGNFLITMTPVALAIPLCWGVVKISGILLRRQRLQDSLRNY